MSDLRNAFVARNGTAASQGKSSDDAWRQFLLASAGKGDGSITDLEKRWLRAKGGTGETYFELWNSFLNTKGYTGGGLGDRKRRFFQTGVQA